MKKSALLLGLLVSATSLFADVNLATKITINGESREAVVSLKAGQVVVIPVSPTVVLSITTKPSEKENMFVLVMELDKIVVAEATESTEVEPKLELIRSVEVEVEFGKEVVIPCPSEIAQAELTITATLA